VLAKEEGRTLSRRPASQHPLWNALYAWDKRNFVKKAVNWALRQMGKRNTHLCAIALECANELESMDSRAAKWIAKDALRELRALADKEVRS
jgi:3-methyladenine DNA glycosylase AlkD